MSTRTWSADSCVTQTKTGQGANVETSVTADSTLSSADPMRGRFNGAPVHTGYGGGLASQVPLSGAAATSFHAARLPDLGDAVLAVTRVFDAETASALCLELRAFSAAAPGRSFLATMNEHDLLEAPGAIAYARVVLSAAGDASDERRAATLERCVVTDAAPTADAARGVADWLRATWEVELAFGSWPAIGGKIAAFAHDSGAPAEWAREWLRATEHRVEDGGVDSDSFLKVLSATWLESDTPADGSAEAATDAE